MWIASSRSARHATGKQFEQVTAAREREKKSSLHCGLHHVGLALEKRRKQCLASFMASKRGARSIVEKRTLLCQVFLFVLQYADVDLNHRRLSTTTNNPHSP